MTESIVDDPLLRLIAWHANASQSDAPGADVPGLDEEPERPPTAGGRTAQLRLASR
jgi:hypothetical protein